eukprot:SAG31_NODE_3375_length_4349_cov_1.941176_2_plen_369_part_00
MFVDGEGFGDPAELKQTSESAAKVGDAATALKQLQADEATDSTTLLKLQRQLRDVLKEMSSEKISHESAKVLAAKHVDKHAGAVERRDASHRATLDMLRTKREKLLSSIFRIELAEIEIVATKVAGVDEAVAVVQEDAGAKQIVLYVASDGLDAQNVMKTCTTWLREPQYMVPSKLVVMQDACPRNKTGKIDVKQLSAVTFGVDLPTIQFERPTTALDEKIAAAASKGQLNAYSSRSSSLLRLQQKLHKNSKDIDAAEALYKAAIEADTLAQSEWETSCKRDEATHEKILAKLEEKHAQLLQTIATKKEQLKIEAATRRDRVQTLLATYASRNWMQSDHQPKPKTVGIRPLDFDKPPWKHPSFYGTAS